MDVEHVQPVRSLTLDSASRTRTLIAVAIPIALFVGVVATGALGRTAVGPGPDGSDAVAVVPDRSAVDAEPSNRRTPSPADLAVAGFPDQIIGLEVRTVSETLDAFDAGSIGADVVAVGGWLTVPAVGGCGDAETGRDLPVLERDLLCQRETFLVDEGLPLFAIEQDGLAEVRPPGRHLRPQAMPGIELVSLLSRQFMGYAPELRPRRVVVAGRFGDRRLLECRLATARCASTFAIERVVWVDGHPILRHAERYPGLDDVAVSRLVRWHTVDAAIQHGAIVLSEVLVPREALATFDPEADREVSRAVAGPVWYVRTLLREGPYGNPAGDVGWAVIEDATAAVLAADPDGPPAPVLN